MGWSVIPFNYRDLHTRTSGAGASKHGKRISAAHERDIRSRDCHADFSKDPRNPTFEYIRRPKGKPVYVVQAGR